LQRILLADDEPDILEVSRIALETVGGFEVAVCSSGAELLQRLPDFSPDLIIIDVMMPDMAGPEVLTRVRQVPGFSETPVIFLTGVINGNELKNLPPSSCALATCENAPHTDGYASAFRKHQSIKSLAHLIRQNRSSKVGLDR